MIHHVFANKSNIGDWLSALGIQSLLAPHETQEHFCDEPFVEETLASLSAASPNDLIVIGGGGLFMDYFVPFWQGFRPIARRVPFCIWGVGYCDLKREPSRPPLSVLKEVIPLSRLCIVRDDLSRRHLADFDLPAAVPCPSMCAISSSAGPGHGLLHVDNYTTAGAEAYEAMDADGREFARSTQRPYWQTNNRIESGSQSALTSLLARYAACDVVLSSALHGCVIAVAMGRKVLAVSGDHKLESFMQAAGLRDWVCDVSQGDAIPTRLARLSEQPAAADFVARACEANRAIGARALTLVAGQK